MRRNLTCAALASAVLLCAGPAQADPTTDRFGQCLVENASPKDQAALIRWMFVGLSANPLLKSMTTVTPAERETYNRAVAQTFERLVLRDCRAEFIAASKAGGNSALEDAFKFMGERAARQLMSDPAAAKELEQFGAYLDEEKWVAAMEEAGLR